MKSIMEEANSTIKAIEKAWNRAGKPFEFSIKIFEKEEKNFIGMTTKQAKIGIFFSASEKKLQETKISTHPSRELKKSSPFKKEQKKPKTPRTSQPRIEQWTNEMVTSSQEWIKKILTFMGLPNVQFKTSVSNNYLTFHFETPVIEDSAKEKILFRSFAHLIMVSLKNKFKTDFKHLKVVLTST